MNIKQTVLIAEDEANIEKLLRTTLKAYGYQTVSAQTGKEALALTSSHNPDILLLDLGLPDMEGLEIIKSLRSWTSMPVIVVSARSNDTDKVQALDAGADDYITKPFSTNELLARIRTAMRHKNASIDENFKTAHFFSFKDLTVDFDRYKVTVSGEDVHLTNIEFKIMKLFCKYPGRVLTHDYIMKEIWGPYSSDDNKILRVNMANLRRKIEKNPANPQYLLTEPGIGYRMADAEQEK